MTDSPNTEAIFAADVRPGDIITYDPFGERTASQVVRETFGRNRQPVNEET